MSFVGKRVTGELLVRLIIGLGGGRQSRDNRQSYFYISAEREKLIAKMLLKLKSSCSICNLTFVKALRIWTDQPNSRLINGIEKMVAQASLV